MPPRRKAATKPPASPIHPDDQPVAELWLRYARNRKSIAIRNRLVEHYFPRGTAMAARMAARLPRNKRDEAVSRCHEAMLRAVQRYRPGNRLAFMGYIRRRMVGAVKDAMREDYRPKRKAFDRLRRRVRVVKSLVDSLGRRPTDEEVAAQLGWTVEELWRDREGMEVSLEDKLTATRNGKALTLLDVLESRPLAHSPWEDANVERLFEEATVALGFQERLVLFLLHCLGKRRARVGEILGIPTKRVGIIERRALTALQRTINAPSASDS
jgi:RNA polymerase sigma factor FliA